MDFRKLLQEERRRAREGAAPEPRPRREASSISDDRGQAPASKMASPETPSEASSEPLSCWTTRSLLDLEPFRVPDIETVFYLPEWLAHEEEDAILSRVYGAPSSAWVQLKLRRLQMHGGEVTTPFRPEPLPRWLQQIAEGLVDTGIFPTDKAPNHALINEYGVGDGILPHEDGPSYYPLVAIASTGADASVTFSPHRKHDDDASLRPIRFAVQRRSLLLFTGHAYTKYLHSIDGVESGKRVSLTIRHVPSTVSDTP